MAIYNILKDGDPILRRKSKEVPKITPNIIKLLDNMKETMHDADGIGLAAPQVGVLKRVVVIDIGDGLVELINPEIIDEEGEIITVEGCLSCPGLSGEVLRSARVKVRALDRDGKEIVLEGDELFGICMQHEIDHLDGILYVDKAKNIKSVE